MFMKLLDDNQLKAEANANLLGVPQKSKVFQDCVISESPRVETEPTVPEVDTKGGKGLKFAYPINGVQGGFVIRCANC